MIMLETKSSHLSQCIIGKKKYTKYKESGISFEQVLEAGRVRRSTDTSSTVNQLQEAVTKAQQAVSSVATEVSQTLGLPAPETVANTLHNQSLSLARTVGQFVGQLQNEVSCLRTFALSS
jgi:ribulose kinase